MGGHRKVEPQTIPESTKSLKCQENLVSLEPTFSIRLESTTETSLQFSALKDQSQNEIYVASYVNESISESASASYASRYKYAISQTRKNRFVSSSNV